MQSQGKRELLFGFGCVAYPSRGGSKSLCELWPEPRSIRCDTCKLRIFTQCVIALRLLITAHAHERTRTHARTHAYVYDSPAGLESHSKMSNTSAVRRIDYAHAKRPAERSHPCASVIHSISLAERLKTMRSSTVVRQVVLYNMFVSRSCAKIFDASVIDCILRQRHFECRLEWTGAADRRHDSVLDVSGCAH